MQPNWTQKTKHKLGIDCMDVVKDDTFIFFIGCFYFILGNMRPQLRSTIKAIQLIALAKTNHITNMVSVQYYSALLMIFYN